MKLQGNRVHSSGSESSETSPFGHRTSKWHKQAPRPLFDPQLHYGDGDKDALYNLFATWPENFFSSLPRPHGNRDTDEPYWELRQSRIFLDDCFRGHGTRRLFTSAIPGPDKLERQRLQEQSFKAHSKGRPTPFEEQRNGRYPSLPVQHARRCRPPYW